MRRWLNEFLLIGTFAIAIAHVAWWTYLCPLPIEGLRHSRVRTLRAPGQAMRNLYVRHNLHLPSRPRSAWIRVRGPGLVELYVNGKQLDSEEAEGTATSIITDLTRSLREGANVLAVICRQSTLDAAPELAIEGEYVLEDGVHRFSVDQEWRCRPYFERTDKYWFAVDFDDRHWAHCIVSESELLTENRALDEILLQSSQSNWIAPTEIAISDVVIQRVFELQAAPRIACLSVQSNSSYRLAVNGLLVARAEDQLGTNIPVQRGSRQVYDIAPLIHPGKNTLMMRLRGPDTPPQLSAMVALRLRDGSTIEIPSDPIWVWRPMLNGSWLEPDPKGNSFRACQRSDFVEGSQPWEVVGKIVPLTLRLEYTAIQVAKRIALTLLIALCAWLCVRWIARWLRGAAKDEAREQAQLAFVAFVLPILYLFAMIIAEYDPRISAEWVYQSRTLFVAIGILFLQWLALAIPFVWRSRQWDCSFSTVQSGQITRSSAKKWQIALAWSAAMMLFSAGTYFRYRDITARPLSPDEVTVHRASLSIWEYGFPTLVISDDMPPVPAATSELVFWGGAVTSLWTDDDRLIVRFVPALFGSITILLVYWVGMKMFHPWVGLAAAAMYAFSPVCIANANIGRYYSQLQFLVLFVTYQFWRTIKPRESLNNRALWCTVVSFIAMYLTWEGSATIAIPMMVVAVVERSNRVSTIVKNSHVWMGMVVIGTAVLVQTAHRTLMQTARPLIGSGASDITLTPMWRFPGFDPWYYLGPSAWTQDMLLPYVVLIAAILLTLNTPIRQPIRYWVIILLTGSLLQACFLPVSATRYGYHYVPMFVLIGAAAVSYLSRETIFGYQTLSGLRARYAHAVSVSVVASFVLLSSGLVVNLQQMTDLRLGGRSLDSIRLPGQEATAAYVRAHWSPGDVLIVTAPHAIDHYLDWNSDYWLESQLHLQATFDDRRPIPIHRFKGTPMIRDVDHLRDVFARHKQVWLIIEPDVYSRSNLDEVMHFIRRNMDVVYEDYQSLVLLKSGSHRSESAQAQSDKSLGKGRSFLY